MSAVDPQLAADQVVPKRRSWPLALIVAVRPHQWTKNVVIFAAPAAAGVLGHPGPAARTAAAFASFVLLACGTYLLNDRADVEQDRRHPVKRYRPIANGEISPHVALVLGVAMLCGGLGVAAAVSLKLLAVAVGYAVLTTAYTMSLKRMVVFDLVAVASTYVLRTVAGGVAADVPLSRWFLIVVCFGALFLVAGKRYGERLTLGAEAAQATRQTLAIYTPEYLRYVWMMASTVTIGAYCLWAFTQRHHAIIPWPELSIVPVLLGILRYAVLLDSGAGGAPEDILLRDRPLLLMGFAWVLIFLGGIYL